MPNWTSIRLYAAGIEDLPIYDEKGNLDYNTVVPMPDYAHDTISPVRKYAILGYLITEYGKNNGAKRFKEMLSDCELSAAIASITDEASFKKMSDEEAVEAFCKEPFTIGFGEGSRTISAYQLGKNYIDLKLESGCWDWYSWALKYWGVKWNACDTYVGEGFVDFCAPWGYPEAFFKALAKRFPDKEFRAEAEFEDDPSVLYVIEFSYKEWNEYSTDNSEYEPSEYFEEVAF
ncbi:MAG: hypothetical protein J6T96_05355 [Bacteroidales bacterium]|nr:hypothetical protein [Bacteroidales bacterium]